MTAVKSAFDKETLAARKAATARANGAKSKGPVSAAGKAIASRNATTHGIYSAQPILPHESREEYQDLHARYHALFQPSTGREEHLVTEIVDSRWLCGRMQSFESEFLSRLIESMPAAVPANSESPDALLACALSRSPKALRTLETVSRAEARCSRRFERAVKALRRQQKIRNRTNANSGLE